MNLKKTLYTSFLMITFFAMSAFAAENHLSEAIKHTEMAVKSSEGKSIAQHAQEAKTHSEAAKSDKTGGPHLDEGIKKLDEAIKEGKLGASDLAKKAAEEALIHLKQATN